MPYCIARAVALGTEGYVAGVAVGRDGPIAVTRFPFAVETEGGPLVEAGDMDADPGFALFHAPSPSGVSCATCHVEGRDDGHTWLFEGMGPRRTQSLVGGLLQTAPYHWDGSLADLHALFEDTGVLRMGMEPVSAATIDALGDWLDALPPPTPPGAGPGADEGRVVYDAACASCHEGPLAVSVDVGTGGVFQIPSLVGLSARLPLMHDGCAATIRARFDPACGGDDHGPPLSDAEIDLLVG